MRHQRDAVSIGHPAITETDQTPLPAGSPCGNHGFRSHREGAAARGAVAAQRSGVMADELLDERLEWPVHQWHHGGRWRLGHGLTVVGPGWWPLVRRAFALVAETPGATVLEVKQQNGLLRVLLRHPNDLIRAQLATFVEELENASRTRCEACGTAVPRVEPSQVVWRNHCAACRARLGELEADDAIHAERHLWEERAGCAWPESES